MKLCYKMKKIMNNYNNNKKIIINNKIKSFKY